MAGASIHATSHSICGRNSVVKHGTFPALWLKPFAAYDVRLWRFGSCVVGSKEEGVCALTRLNGEEIQACCLLTIDVHALLDICTTVTRRFTT
ncbi:hypothetical protein HBI56_198330 [Parastagonospora nodorum]|uniref:Uncharacterized protein n=1 Tax=Phaeosphaeria nodorum (strain SN15 / ATCC MYA-4574 / FGSC 10173) TaxID=321614 RepID=A0A7U2FAM4_PHANO|nr:hypothetical protein HBH56_203040 [Parastagonospora nodorum]QRD01755.1 hypothetical protein JI435_145020 [Parastagonospora nodorum SN15]KAH3923864.1 hypothetical protein HBH54_201910 [Parastagonospora nodorum]KAH3941411.1 hypothetical protein HBH53_202140 [Parastagonospora nodorum]KAH3959595.1 hypothetical protein HBH51_198370 [Parastagonospora nodorum]